MLRGEEKACQLKLKTWAKIYVAIHSIIIILIIAQLATPKWVVIESSETIKGGILECNEGCGDKMAYQELYDDNCGSSYDNSYYNHGYYEDSNGYSQKLCDSMNDLSKAGKTKIALDIVSIFFIVLWSVTMLVFPKFKCIRCLNSLFAFLSFLFFLIGTVSWMIRTQVQFGDCTLDICASDGPKLSLAILVILVVSMNFYLYIIRALYYQRRMVEMKKSHGVFGDPRVIIGTAQPQNNIVMPPPVANSHQMPQPVVYSQAPPVYSQPVYGQPVYGQPVYGQPVYGQPIYPQVVTPGFGYPVNNSYNPNINDGKNKNLEENDLTVLDNTKNPH